MSNRLHGNITMDDIAEKLGISKSTVSRALAGSGRISDETVKKVNECAKALGFKPNLVAKALAKQQTLNIAVVMPSESKGVQMMFFHECLSGIVTSAEKAGYNVLVCMTNDDEGGNDSLIEVLKYRKVDAVILTQLKRDDKNLSLLKEAKIPFVVIGSGAGIGVTQVDSRTIENCSDFTQKCLSKLEDSQQVLFVCGELDIIANNNRLLGFMSGMEKACVGKKSSIQYAICSDVNDLKSGESLKNWGMIICSDDVVCVQVLHLLRDGKINIGTDVKIASFHDSVLLEYSSPSVSALKVDALSLGTKAMEKALDLISKKEVESMTYIDCSIQMRESL